MAARSVADPRLGRIARRLLDWFTAAQRELPWRLTPEPYAVLVSEIMLQQTQASRVAAKFHDFLQRFPTIADLARADTAEVITAWRGLGYNRRAVALQRAARAVVDHHDGVIPSDVESLRALPGVGDYTARAVAAFAFGRDVAPVDVNVGRVLQRALAGASRTRAQTQELADTAVVRGQAAAWASALMDLGATVCTARSPRCDDCPIVAECAWQAVGGDDPAARTPRRTRRPFVQTDRFHRGRLVDALRAGPVMTQHLPAAAQLAAGPRLDDIVRGLVDDGLARWEGGVLRLPA